MKMIGGLLVVLLFIVLFVVAMATYGQTVGIRDDDPVLSTAPAAVAYNVKLNAARLKYHNAWSCSPNANTNSLALCQRDAMNIFLFETTAAGAAYFGIAHNMTLVRSTRAQAGVVR